MDVIQKFSQELSKNSPSILTSIGVVGVFSTAILAVRGTPKALAILDDYKKYHNLTKVSKLDTMRLVWRCYVPSIVVGIGASSCIIAAHKMSMRKSAALASLYTLTETALKEYQSKVEESLGTKKEQWIRDEIDKEAVRNNPPVDSKITFTGNGDVLVYDRLSGRYFTSDIDKIRKAINEANYRLLTQNNMSLNELYYDLGLQGISLGEDVGWDTERGLIDPSFSSQLTENERPCLVLNLNVHPL